MKKLIVFLFCFSSTMSVFSNDSLKIESLERKMNELSENVQEVKRDQNNYSIEKNLLKETYSNNYDRIQLVITGILGLLGFIAFFGIKDINSIKKEYKEELKILQTLKSEFEAKSKDFDIKKNKFESEIKKIFEQNEQQNKKIKVLEIKEKVSQLIIEEEYISALEYIDVAINFDDKDVNLFNKKAIVLSRLNRFNDSLKAFEKALDIEPGNHSHLRNYIECLYFVGNSEYAEEIAKKNSEIFNADKENYLFKYFQVLAKFNDKNISLQDFCLAIKDIFQLKNSSNKIDLKGFWDFKDVLYFIYYNEKNEKSPILKSTIKYLDGKYSDEELFAALTVNN